MARLGRLWQMLSIDLPWAVSNWLWAQTINPFLASLHQIKPHKVVYVAAFMVFAVAAAEMYFPAEVAAMLAGDFALYIEAVTFTYLAVARTRLHRALKPAMATARTALTRGGQRIVRVAARAKRPLRLPRLFDSEDSGDAPDGAFAFA